MTQPEETAEIYLQYKGTDVCLDFTCGGCGAGGHFDGDFAYDLMCPSCGRVYAMPEVLTATLLDATKPEWGDRAVRAKVPQMDEEDA